MKSIAHFSEENTRISTSLDQFFQVFSLSSLLRRCRIQKKRGVSTTSLFQFVFRLPFTGKNLYHTFASSSTPVDFSIHTVYRFWKKATYHWSRFLLLVSTRCIKRFVHPYNNADRIPVIIADDTMIAKPYSSHMDMLSYVWDHAEGKSRQGFSCLTLGWSDGSTFCPLSFRLLTSKRHHVNDTYWDWTWNRHPSSLAYQRREGSTESKPTVLVSLLQEAQQAKIPARHVVFDSWYTSPALCREIVSKTGYHCIGLLKNNRTRYRRIVGSETALTYSSPMRLSELYALCRKEGEESSQQSKIRLSKKIHLRIYGDIQVSLGDIETGCPLRAKIVFVSAHHHGKKTSQTRSWIAILSTDTTLSSQEIVRLYSKRWDIEVFFKTMKSLLHVEKEYQFRSFDSMIAYMTMSFVRYIYLAWHSRQNTDVRTYGELYYQVWDELQDVTFQEAMERVLSILQKIMIDNFPAVAEKIHTLFTLFMQTLPSYTLGRLRYMNCKS